MEIRITWTLEQLAGKRNTGSEQQICSWKLFIEKHPQDDRVLQMDPTIPNSGQFIVPHKDQLSNDFWNDLLEISPVIGDNYRSSLSWLNSISSNNRDSHD